MIFRDVTVEINNSLKIAKFKCDRKNNILIVKMPDETERSYNDVDLYMCLGKVRQEFPDVKFLCKGSKLNVHPSRMSSQMSGGIIAYEVIAGEPADDDKIVNIFDYEDKNLTNNIQEQINYYQSWLQSLNKDNTSSNQDS